MKTSLPWIAAAAGLILVLALYWLTLHESQKDPCAGLENDVSAAILADDARSGDALANRAMLQRRACEERLKEKSAESATESAAAKAPE